MILADKIIELRKKAGLSQDELAEQMNVSRQSVPDLNKILKLSEIFGVSTDYLLKDDFEKSAPEISETITDSKPLRRVSMEEANRFLAVNERSAFKTASGVALCILSVVPTIIIFYVLSGALADTLGVVLMFLMVAGAVGLFISTGADKKTFRYLTKEGIDTAYGVEGMLKEKQAKFSPMHTRDLIIGVILCILSVIPPILTDSIYSESGFYDCLGVCILFIMVAGGVFLIVRASITKKGFSKLLEEDRFTREKKSREKQNTGSITGSYWLIVTAGYLAYSFITVDWGRSWIVFPVAALLTPIVHNIEKSLKSR